MRALGWLVLLAGGAGVAAVQAARSDVADPPDGSSAADRYGLTGEPAWVTELPGDLMEVSGIAFTSDGRLFAHGDEDATVWELGPRGDGVRKVFYVTAPAGAEDGKKAKKGKKKGPQRPGAAAGAAIGDFEDIAIVGDRFFLVTSDGTIHEFREGADGAKVSSTVHATGLGERCEVEGLEHDPASRALLLLCKENRPKKSAPKQVIVRAWSLERRELEPEPRLVVDYAKLAATGADEFNGSAFAFVPDSRSLLLVAGPQRTFAELGADGAVVAAGALARGVHRQPEGLAFAPDGTLIIANEGAGETPLLAGYTPRKPASRASQ